MQLCSSLNILWHCHSMGLEWKLTFSSLMALYWVFQICRHIECSTFTASSFRIWNSSTGIPSPPLALFVVMLSKAHLTLHSRMSGSRWVITPSWLSGSWRSFLYSSSVYSCQLFLISSASVRSCYVHTLCSRDLDNNFKMLSVIKSFMLRFLFCFYLKIKWLK